MKIEVIVLGKNHYDMEGQKGANLVLAGDHEETNNKSGISISESAISYDEHFNITVFPARYKADATFVSTKNRSGKSVTSLKLSNLQLVERLEFVGVKDGISK